MGRERDGGREGVWWKMGGGDKGSDRQHAEWLGLGGEENGLTELKRRCRWRMWG